MYMVLQKDLFTNICADPSSRTQVGFQKGSSVVTQLHRFHLQGL